MEALAAVAAAALETVEAEEVLSLAHLGAALWLEPLVQDGRGAAAATGQPLRTVWLVALEASPLAVAAAVARQPGHLALVAQVEKVAMEWFASQPTSKENKDAKTVSAEP